MRDPNRKISSNQYCNICDKKVTCNKEYELKGDYLTIYSNIRMAHPEEACVKYKTEETLEQKTKPPVAMPRPKQKQVSQK